MSIGFAEPVKLDKKFLLSYMSLLTLSTKSHFRNFISRAAVRHRENSVEFQRSRSL